MADKSDEQPRTQALSSTLLDEEIQIMEGFTSTSDSDNRRCESIIWPNHS
jgi:hypothetical protein